MASNSKTLATNSKESQMYFNFYTLSLMDMGQNPLSLRFHGDGDLDFSHGKRQILKRKKIINK